MGQQFGPARWKYVGPDLDSGIRALADGLAPGQTASYLGSCFRRVTQLHRFDTGATGPGQVVIKVFDHPGAAERASAATDRLAGLLAPTPDRQEPIVLARPALAVAPDQRALVLQWVEAPGMRGVMDAEPGRITEMMRRGGAALAVIHDRAAQAPGGTTAVSARTFRLGTPRAEGRHAVLVRRMVDFHPHNLLVGPQALEVIDPPAGDEYTYVHHDMVSFLYKVQKNLLAGGFDAGRVGGAVHLVDPIMSFFRAYFTTTTQPMTTADAALIDRYLRLYIGARQRRARRRRDLFEASFFGPLLRWQVHRAFDLAAESARKPPPSTPGLG
ncbi:MAG: hypothetical protein ACT4OS_12550 [Acidimicrobiales bacterium]